MLEKLHDLDRIHLFLFPYFIIKSRTRSWEFAENLKYSSFCL